MAHSRGEGVNAGEAGCDGANATSYTTLDVKPYLIYQHTSVLYDDVLEELVNWAGGPGNFGEFLENNHHGFDVLKTVVEVAEHQEIAAEEAKELLSHVEAVELIANGIPTALLINKSFEAVAMFDLFLQASGLSSIGIGSKPFEASANGDPSATFIRELMNQLAFTGVLSPLKTGTGGFWSASAEDIRKTVEPGAGLNDQHWSLETSVYEVSHCDDELGLCAPGYGNKPGQELIDNAGIQPQLFFELSLVDDTTSTLKNGPGSEVAAEEAVAIPYDADAWTTTQADLKGVIQDR